MKLIILINILIVIIIRILIKISICELNIDIRIIMLIKVLGDIWGGGWKGGGGVVGIVFKYLWLFYVVEEYYGKLWVLWCIFKKLYLIDKCVLM